VISRELKHDSTKYQKADLLPSSIITVDSVNWSDIRSYVLEIHLTI